MHCLFEDIGVSDMGDAHYARIVSFPKLLLDLGLFFRLVLPYLRAL